MGVRIGTTVLEGKLAKYLPKAKMEKYNPLIQVSPI